jgi:VanZ family protein
VSDTLPPISTPLVSRHAAATLWGLLTAFIVYGSFGAVSTDGSRAAALPGLSLPDVVQNVLLYIPFGVVGIWTLQPARPRTVAPFVRVAAIGLACSVAVELMQALSALRISSTLDIAANVAGTALGCSLAGRAEQAIAGAHRAIKPTGLFDARLRYLLAAAVAGAALLAWYPYDLTLDVSTLSERARLLRADPWLWSGSRELWLQGLGFFTTAALLTACLQALGTRAAVAGVVVTLVIALLIDIGQLAMGRKPIGVASAAAQAIGVAAGAMATSIGMYSSRRRRMVR